MRHELGKFLEKEVLFYAVFGRYEDTPKRRTVAVIQDIRIKDNPTVLADHVWINRTSEMKDLKLKEGDIVSFYGKVERYTHAPGTKNSKVGVIDYGISRIKDFRLHRHYSSKDERWPHFLNETERDMF
jgi:hypothetical protein